MSTATPSHQDHHLYRQEIIEQLHEYIVGLSRGRLRSFWAGAGLTVDEAIEIGCNCIPIALMHYKPDRGAKLTTFFYHVFVSRLNHAIKSRGRRCKREMRYKGWRIHEVKCGYDNGFTDLDLPDVLQRMRQELKQLPKYWQDVVRRRLNGESFADIGRRYGVSKTRPMQVYNEAIKRLRENMQDCENPYN